MRRALFGFGLLALLAAPAAAAEPAPPAAPWVSLFDGKTLKGWIQRGGAARFEVKDGTIVGTSVPNTKNTFLCTERRYGDFVLEYEFQVDPALNSGVQIRSQSRAEYQDGRVHGMQVEIDPDVKRGRLWTGGIQEEGRRGWLADLKDNEPARLAFRPGAWNQIRVEARGDSIKTWINGVAAADLVDSMELEGFIALQVHQVKGREEPLRVAWRNLRVQELGQRAWLPLFDGADLRGFHAAGGGSWKVQDGVMVGALAAGERRAGLLFADRPAGDFTIRLEARLTGGNGGVYLRARAADTAAGAAGVQLDLDAQKGAPGLYETGGRGWLRPPVATPRWKAGDWNEITLSARGTRVVAHVNGARVADLAAAPADAGNMGLMGLELAPGGEPRLEVRRLEALSDPIPPPVAGFPIGRCVKVLNISAPEDARTAGFEYVELSLPDLLPLPDEEFARTVTRIQALGIPALSGYGFMPADARVVGPSLDAAREAEQLERGLDRAARLGLKMVVFGNAQSRRFPDGFAPAQAWKQLVEFGRRAGRAAEKHGLTVLLEPMPRKATNLVNTVAEGLALVKAVGHPRFQLLVDYTYMVAEQEDLAILHKAAPHIRQIEIANPNGRVYPRSADEADYAAFFRALRRGGYRGGFSVHGKPDVFFADAPRALTVLRRLAAEALGPTRPGY